MHRAITCLLVALCAVGCERTPANYSKAVTDGLQSIQSASEFDALFPNAEHSISYYTGEYGRPAWNSQAGLHGRYIISLQVYITFDRRGRKIASQQIPTFVLVEVSSIDLQTRATRYNPESELRFGKAKWREFVESGGDISVLVAEPNTQDPIPGFDRIWRSS